jgi:hypothetical protein
MSRLLLPIFLGTGALAVRFILVSVPVTPSHSPVALGTARFRARERFPPERRGLALFAAMPDACADQYRTEFLLLTHGARGTADEFGAFHCNKPEVEIF